MNVKIHAKDYSFRLTKSLTSCHAKLFQNFASPLMRTSFYLKASYFIKK